jgi:hypothetical protein
MMQTAIEWFEKELQENFDIEGVQPLYDQILEEALEIHKQQIIESYSAGVMSQFDLSIETGEHYYNKNFKLNGN